MRPAPFEPHDGVPAPAPISLSTPSGPQSNAMGCFSKASCSCVVSSSPESTRPRHLASRAACVRIQSFILDRVSELLLALYRTHATCNTTPV